MLNLKLATLSFEINSIVQSAFAKPSKPHVYDAVYRQLKQLYDLMLPEQYRQCRSGINSELNSQQIVEALVPQQYTNQTPDRLRMS